MLSQGSSDIMNVDRVVTYTDTKLQKDREERLLSKRQIPTMPSEHQVLLAHPSQSPESASTQGKVYKNECSQEKCTKMNTIKNNFLKIRLGTKSHKEKLVNW